MTLLFTFKKYYRVYPFGLEVWLSLSIIAAFLLTIGLTVPKIVMEKAKLLEAVQLMAGVKTDLTEYYSLHGHFPDHPDFLKLTRTSGKYTTGLAIHSQGVITATHLIPEESEINGLTLSFRPALPVNSPAKVIIWACGNATVPNHFVLQGESQTNIPLPYLTATCR